MQGVGTQTDGAEQAARDVSCVTAAARLAGNGDEERRFPKGARDDSVAQLGWVSARELLQIGQLAGWIGQDDAEGDLSRVGEVGHLSLIHISEPTRRTPISYAVFC